VLAQLAFSSILESSAGKSVLLILPAWGCAACSLTGQTSRLTSGEQRCQCPPAGASLWWCCAPSMLGCLVNSWREMRGQIVTQDELFASPPLQPGQQDLKKLLLELVTIKPAALGRRIQGSLWPSFTPRCVDVLSLKDDHGWKNLAKS
jgi:hypothetical protein